MLGGTVFWTRHELVGTMVTCTRSSQQGKSTFQQATLNSGSYKNQRNRTGNEEGEGLFGGSWKKYETITIHCLNVQNSQGTNKIHCIEIN